jgi:Fur family ferric uptake transcriptional regulator
MAIEIRELLDYLKTHKLKTTKTRRLIFQEILSSSDVHPNAYEIHNTLTAKGEKVSLASVYRTLALLVKTGLVSQIDLGEDHSHYEPEGAKSGHGHLICRSCGAVREFSDSKIPRLIGKLGRHAGFAFDKVSIQVFGYCAACRKK